MTTLLVLLFAGPFAAGLAGVLVPRLAKALAVLGTLGALVIALILALEVDPSATGAAVSVREEWIPSIGVEFHLAVDGLNAALLVMTTFVWLLGTAWSLRDRELATPNYLLMLAIAQSAVLGAFLAQDLILFALCFDLMLLPFVVITARGGGKNPLGAALQLLVYTLVGSLLMLVAVVALGILAASSQGAPVTFDIATLATNGLSTGTQKWIFAALLAAFLIKMPVVPVHRWMPDAYRTMPLPALAIFAAALSKVAAYGFLKVALPILPEAVVDWRLLLVIVALASILYGSLVALTTDEPRLVLGYSSVAQLGFILLGISSLDPAGAQGAIMQSVTHALLVVPAVVLITVVFERAGGTERLGELGGLARRAPVLAACFLLVALCWLALPGTGNFVAEYLVLFGQWQLSPWATIIASAGIALAAVYVLRLMIGMMQNQPGSAVGELDDAAGERRLDVSGGDRAVLAISIAALAMLSLVPQAALHHSKAAARMAVETPRGIYETRNATPADPVKEAIGDSLVYEEVEAAGVTGASDQSPEAGQ